MVDEAEIATEPALRIRVPFRDVDMHGHVHNGAYYAYCEAALTEFCRKRGLSIYFWPNVQEFAYHVRKTELLFNGSSTFEEELFCHVSILRVGDTSITFEVGIYGVDETVPRVEASIIWVHVNLAERRPHKIPSKTRTALLALKDEALPKEQS